MFADFATVAPLERVMGVAMRGDDQICGSLFSYIDLEARILKSSCPSTTVTTPSSPPTAKTTSSAAC